MSIIFPSFEIEALSEFSEEEKEQRHLMAIKLIQQAQDELDRELMQILESAAKDD